jgi:hypothetical protein
MNTSSLIRSSVIGHVLPWRTVQWQKLLLQISLDFLVLQKVQLVLVRQLTAHPR